MFASGIGVQRDDSKAARHYLAAATGGVPRAMFDLAVLYARGRGVLKDDVAAVATGWTVSAPWKDAPDLSDGSVGQQQAGPAAGPIATVVLPLVLAAADDGVSCVVQ